MTEQEHRRQMNDEENQCWWQLHRRVSLDEPLADAERAAYMAGLSRLHTEEVIDGDIAALQATRQRLQRQSEELKRLHALEEDLMRQISAIEARLDDRTRHALGMAPVVAG